MEQLDREATPHFSQPLRQIVMMLIVLGLVGIGAKLVFPTVGPVFLSSPWLNGVIVLVFVIGVLACFGQLYQLMTSVVWIERFTANRPGQPESKAPRLMVPLAALLRGRGARMQISTTSSGSILESVGARIEEQREITRYIVNLLIFLGLLGTFYGLATTVPALVDTIKSLAPKEGEGGVVVFSRLMTGLEKQLGGMGTAFSSSLLGLAGSLVVGLLEIFAGHGQNRFYRELEEWLSSITKLGFSSGEMGELEAVVGVDQGLVAAVLKHLGEQMEAMQTMFTQSDVSRALVDEKLGQLAQAVAQVARKMDAEVRTQSATAATMARLADGQEALLHHFSEQAQAAQQAAQQAREALGEHAGEGQADAESRMRLRSIDVQLLRILEEISAGRQESMIDLRGDLAALTRAIRSLAAPGSGHGRGQGDGPGAA